MSDFFQKFYAEVRKTPHWKVMEGIVEGSEWHREANVAVHTDMCIQHYLTNTAAQRTTRQQVMTLMTLLFHDFGKPEAQETLPMKDGSEGTYNRYAGHEPVSANEFVSFMCEHPELTRMFFAQGFGWSDVRKIKFMIEHHLPFGLKNPTKRANLRAGVVNTLGSDEVCFYDQLWSDCNGRVSDNHETKRANVTAWVEEFKTVVPAKTNVKSEGKTMYVLVGTVGAGKSTWTEQLKAVNRGKTIEVISEDAYRMSFATFWLQSEEFLIHSSLGPKEKYASAWKNAFENSKAYDQYAKDRRDEAIKTGHMLVLDRTNQSRKSRGPWIAAARAAGYRIMTIEFYISENVMHARQKTRPDKDVPYNRAHQIYMNFDVPQVGVEVDAFEIVPPF